MVKPFFNTPLFYMFPQAMMNPLDKQQIDRTLTILQQRFGEALIGAYLFGSAVKGGLQPESDLDILVVSRRHTTRNEKKILARDFMYISGRTTPAETWRRIEVTIIVQSDVKPWRYPPNIDFQYGDWLREEFQKGYVEPSPSPARPDLALLATMAIAADTPLFGPPPANILDQVPHQDVLRAMLDETEPLLSNLDSDTRNVLLTLARMWSTFATGAILSKDEAANWALKRLPEHHQAVLLRARDAYHAPQAERWDNLSKAIVPCAEYMVKEIRFLASSS